MTALQPKDFSSFFQAVHGHSPFPWQRMLLERVAREGWPEGIDLPTASGKTACMDVAIFALALGAQAVPEARRRIFFVVDRRIVVDEAYGRALRVAEALRDPRDPVLRTVAERLGELSGSDTPLVVSRLRGGTAADDAWRIRAAQPAVITSTVDQLGSRLLFRSYGSGPLSASVEAGLVGCDSLILLDEAHCAVPFMQTLRACRRYAGPEWVEDDSPPAFPLCFSILSATLPAETTTVFPPPEQRAEALDSDILRSRTQAHKPAKLLQARKPGKRSWSLGEHVSDDLLVLAAAQQAADYVGSGHHRVAVMVNRVLTAGAIHRQLRNAAEAGLLEANVVLMTGRMRPFDRDRLVEQWSPVLKAGPDRAPDRPVILVTTQCLEVGADFSFDSLVTECASLDALRQRFGRLDRLGLHGSASAAVLIRKGDIKPEDKLKDDSPLDPIYGNAMARTWNWLESQKDEDGYFDFGIDAIETRLPGRDQLVPLLAPTADAPVLLPAHLDLLCQTGPRPAPDPDIGLFLHGPNTGWPEARIVFRADLDDHAPDAGWLHAATLLPPLAGEALAVPLPVLRRWLASQPTEEAMSDVGDVEGGRPREPDRPRQRARRFLIWRGRKESEVSTHPRSIRPNETIMVPAAEKLAASLGHAFTRSADSPLDIAEAAYLTTREQPVLRLLLSVLAPWRHLKPIADLLAWSRSEERDRSELPELLSALAGWEAPERFAELPAWLRDAATRLLATRLRAELHPAGGIVLLGSPKSPEHAVPEPQYGDADDALSATEEDVELSAHVDRLARTVRDWAERCVCGPLRDALVQAARVHDLGKADPRFQILLHGSETDAAVALARGTVLAKSKGPRRPWQVQRRLREAAGLPTGFRHEMLSIQLATAPAAPSLDAQNRDLVLHLVASHHGHARPFAPVVVDEELPAIEARIGEDVYRLGHEQRRDAVPPHRLDSGVPQRFWALTRRYGWWGLAYLEALVRAADHSVSAHEAALEPQQQGDGR